MTTYVCSCGSRQEGALARDMHAVNHMPTWGRPEWYKRQLAKQRAKR